MLDEVLAAIAHPARRAMVQRLAHGPATTGQLAALVPISRPAVSQHLGQLRTAGLVRSAGPSRSAPNVLVPEQLSLVEQWTREQLDRWRTMFGPSGPARSDSAKCDTSYPEQRKP